MSKPKFDLKKTYLGIIYNSCGTNIFKRVFVKKNNKIIDVCDNGRLSCAVFVSYVLKLFDLIKTPHATVLSTIIDLENSGWYKITKPKIGSVLVWEEGDSSNGHRHIGFYIGNNKAISNSSKLGVPKVHHWTYGLIKNKSKRAVMAMYWHNKLDM